MSLRALVFCALALLLAAPLALSACDDTGSADPTREERGLSVAKGDLPGTCEASCGGHGQGACWCDALCTFYGDCCADKVQWCDAPQCAADTDCPDNQWCQTSAGTCEPHVGVNDFCTYGGMCKIGLGCINNRCTVLPEPEPEPDACFIGGCSGQVCSDNEGVITTCEWKFEYACYKQPGATCERQPDGACGWTMEGAAAQCLGQATGGCAPVLCELACEAGFKTDADGCQLCECNEPEVEGCASNDDCAAGEFCQQVWCITTPCPALCTPVGGEGDPCQDDAMCATGLSCAAGQCAEPAPAGACEGYCGGESAEGCWCDDACDYYGDCCDDVKTTCD